MQSIKIYNESCFDTMRDMPIGQADIILTSPPYNTNRKAGKTRNITNTKSTGYSYLRYDTQQDCMTVEEYNEFTERLFLEFDRILNMNGVILYNMSYGAENTAGMFSAINTIIEKTPFTVADVIVWKKRTAVPNNCSKNRLTRIVEFIFVICRKEEQKTFRCNKKIKGYRKTGQASFENIFNFIEAKNNDGICPYNKATYSTDLCKKLLSIYADETTKWVYDPFIGSGTTAVACAEMGLNCIGSEISQKQVEFAKERLVKECRA